MLEDLGYAPIFSHAGATFHKYDYDYDHILDDIDDFMGNKIILLTRDPRDTVISYYHHHSYRLDVFEGTLNDFLHHPQYGIQAICAFNTGWLKHAHQFNGFHTVRYEDFKAASIQTMKVFLNFMGTSRKEKHIQKVIQNNEFSKMQKKEKSGELEKRFPNRFSKPGNIDKNSLKVRKGIAGGYKNSLNEEELKYCDEIMEKYGYDPKQLNTIKGDF